MNENVFRCLCRMCAGLALAGSCAASVHAGISVAPSDDLVALVAAANDGDVFELDDDTYTARDLDGNSRVRFRKVDAGCYECQLSRGLTILVR